MPTVHHRHCPVCSGQSIRFDLKVVDHSVSKESFDIWFCPDCTLRFTQDVPDEAAIGVYYQSQDYISHTNTSKGIINQLYQRVRNHTLASKASLIKSFTREKGKLLDMGAGIGAFVHTMKQHGWDATGIEPDEGARGQAKALYDLQLEPANALSTLEENSFDAITMWHVLEHVHDLHGYMEKLKALLVKDGRLFIAVPNYTSGDASIYKDAWAAYDVPRHLYHFTPKSIDTLMGRHDLQVMEKKPMWFDSFYISLLSSKYRNGSTSWIGAALSGLRSNIQAIGDRDKCSSLIYVVRKR
jgi:SAM-dependent methyltransferase